MWLVAVGKIFTMDNLWKQRIIVVDRCCMCKRNEESIDHLLLHFEVVCAIWNVFLSLFGLSWDLYASWWTSNST